MGLIAAAIWGVATPAAGVPLAAISYSTPKQGPLRLAPQWWRGGSSPWWWTTTFALVSGVSSILVGLRIHGAVLLPAYVALCLLGTAVAAVDIRQKRLPFALTLAMLGVGLAGFLAQSIVDNRYDDLLRAILGGIAASGFLVALALAAPGQLGLGDVVLASILAASLAWLGWTQLLRGMLAAPALALLLRLTVRFWRATDESDGDFAFGPFLLTGWVLGIAAGS